VNARHISKEDVAMKKMLAVAALATLALGGCGAFDENPRAFVQGINDDTAAQPVASSGMWRLSNGLVVPMGYAPEQISQDQLVLSSVTVRQPGMIR
jgi:hypothetical protein